MEIISGVNQKKRCLFDMEIHPYLRDHHLERKTILPAVESMILLARAVKLSYPQMNLNCLQKATFLHFLPIAPDVTSQPVFVNIEPSGDSVVTASLWTSLKSKTGHISREIEHAQIDFIVDNTPELSVHPFHVVNKLKGDCISIPSATVYRELIPFGAAYQNIAGDLSVSTAGALAYISGGNHEADEGLLGSPFPMDTVMHLASVWGQRFSKVVSFPVGFQKRLIYQKTKKREEYLGRVVPVSVTQESLIFDAWIYDQDGVMYESIRGIEMKDVTRGRLRPPEWIKAEF